MRFDDMAARARANESRKLVVVGAHESNILKKYGLKLSYVLKL